MAITVVQAAPIVQNPSLTTATVTLANPTGAGNSLVVCVTTHADTTNPAVSTITLGGSADNFAAVETNTGAASAIYGTIWYDPACAAGQTSVVVTCTGGAGTQPAIYVAVYEISGVLLADQHTSSTGAAVTTWTSGTTGTTTVADEIFIAGATGSTSIPTVTGVGTWNSLSNGTGTFDLISGSRIVSATGTATYSGTMTSGNYTALVATFSQVPPPLARGAARPGKTWQRRFHHRQALPPPPSVTAAQAGPPVYPLGHPVIARQQPQQGGHTASRDGTYAQAGPPVKAAEGPTRARVPQPVRGGQVTRRAGVYAQLGPAVRALASAVAGRLRGLPARGRTATRAGVYAQLGPPVRALASPIQARRLPARGGRATGRAGVFTAPAVATAPAIPLHSPVRARIPGPVRKGSTQSSAVPQACAYGSGTYGSGPYGCVPAPTWRSQPVRARPPLPARGRATGRAGTFTAAAAPVVVPRQLGHPVQAKRQPVPGGRVVRRAGTYAQAGPPVKPLAGPVGVYRRQPPPPTRGRTASQRGPYAQAGPPVVRLRRPVRGQPQRPLLTGRADWRAGVYTAPLIAPFTVGALSASTAPTATQAPADKATNALGASTGPSGGTLTARDQRTGGPG